VLPGPARLSAMTRIPALRLSRANLLRVRGNPYRPALLPRPLSVPASKAAAVAWRVSKAHQLDWLLWRGATWCYVAYAAVAAAGWRRRDWTLLVIVAMVVGQQLTVLADNPAQEFRYMVSPLVAGIMLIPLFFAGPSSRRRRRSA
jgi:hypothetical protein